MSLIFSLIYINKIFNKVLETSSLVMSLFFVNDISFITSNSSIKEIIKLLEKLPKNNRIKKVKYSNL